MVGEDVNVTVPVFVIWLTIFELSLIYSSLKWRYWKTPLGIVEFITIISPAFTLNIVFIETELIPVLDAAVEIVINGGGFVVPI